MTDIIPDMAERSMRERIARAIYEETSRQVSAEKADLGKMADAVLPIFATFLRERGKRLNAHALDVELTIAEMLDPSHE